MAAANASPADVPTRSPTAQAATPAPDVKVNIAATSPPNATAATASSASPSAAPARSLDAEEVASLVQRGEQLMQSGDIASARLLLQRAAEANDATAALALGASYDPVILQMLRTYGPAGDLAKASAWYNKARDLGSPEAAARLERLARMGQ